MTKDHAILERMRKNYKMDSFNLCRYNDLMDYLQNAKVDTYKNPICIDRKGNVIAIHLKFLALNDLLEYIIEFRNLEQLTISNCKKIDLPKDFFNLTKLRHLSIEESFLKSIPKGISNLRNLESLNLPQNHLKVFPEEITELNNLKYLSLKNNEIESIPESIYKLSNLRALHLSNNKIRELPSSIVKLDLEIGLFWYRDGITLDANPLMTPPIEIIQKGRNALIEYFNSLEGEKEAINEVKVILVGDGGSGKTSLVKQLLGEKFNKNESKTHGINIRNWMANRNGNEITIHFWDFGGQEIMHSTHQFFLSKRSLYILVLDGRKDEKTEYWLKHIESFGGNSPILVVLNKIDQNSAFDVNRKFLKEKYKSIKVFSRVSCATQYGISEFSESLINELSSIEILETTWAKSWFNVKSKLEKMQHPFISFKEYNDLCHKENITEEYSKETLVEFLHDLGVIIHFSDIQLLDTHVLEPKWVTEAVYKIINSKDLAKRKGILEIQQLNKVLKKKDENDYFYPPDKYVFIIDLMMKFELCYTIDKQTILIPDLLEIQEPEYDFEYDNSLKFIVEYDFMPKSVMPRFMVRMHNDIVQNLRWRTGVVLEDNDCKCIALIKSDEREKKISIFVNGERKRDYFSVIRRSFREINGSFEKLEVTELIPLPDQNEICIEYQDLIGYEQMGKEEYTVGKLRKSYSVSELLNGIEKEKDRKQKYKRDEMGEVFNIHAEKVIIGKSEEKISKNIVNIDNGATFHGDFLIGNKIKDSYNKADSSNVADDLKELLKALALEVAKIAEQLTKDQAERVAKNLKTFTSEATSEKPDREWLELAAKGINVAANTVDEIGVSVISNLKKITALF